MKIFSFKGILLQWKERGYEKSKSQIFGRCDLEVEKLWSRRGKKEKIDRNATVKMSKAKVMEIKSSCLKNRNSVTYETFFQYHAMYDFEDLEAEVKSDGKRYED